MKDYRWIIPALMMAAAPAVAQEPAAPWLPGDGPPPPMAAMLAPPRPANAPRPAPPPAPVGPSQAMALRAAQAALAQCARDGLKVGVAVTDSGGNLLVGLMADGATPGRIYFAARKAYAAQVMAAPTSVVQQRLRDGDSATRAAVTPAMAFYPGAVPLMKGGVAIGAIGTSGGTGQQDEVCSAAGAAAVLGSL